jgi:hypothetical protein
MGSCCFTPKKRDFLWWYWLVLISIVGIPMLLAVMYVARGDDDNEEEKRRRGKTAAWIFWGSAYAMAIAAFFAVRVILSAVYGTEAVDFLLPANDDFAGWSTLALQFFLALAAANGTHNLIRKRRWFVKLPLLAICTCLYVVFIVFLCPAEFHFKWPGTTALQFIACMLPARYWGQFKDLPDQRRAWKAFFAFIFGATLFFFVSHGIEDASSIREFISLLLKLVSALIFGQPIWHWD